MKAVDSNRRLCWRCLAPLLALPGLLKAAQLGSGPTPHPSPSRAHMQLLAPFLGWKHASLTGSHDQSCELTHLTLVCSRRRLLPVPDWVRAAGARLSRAFTADTAVLLELT